MQEHGRNLRNASMMVDMAHIAIGIFIVVLAAVSFLNPEDHLSLFPIIFFLAGVLNLVNGIFKIKTGGREKKKKAAGTAVVFFGVLLLALSAVSAVSIWRG